MGVGAHGVVLAHRIEAFLVSHAYRPACLPRSLDLWRQMFLPDSGKTPRPLLRTSPAPRGQWSGRDASGRDAKFWSEVSGGQVLVSGSEDKRGKTTTKVQYYT
ncbi:hypothetical protein VNO78_10858 [Psophocarpus tetragonolobus]|uniref:Uncharacterized protein n=1 Tax=Psophocarpus tetragonolobus TaxID=3891 RepID=A0AAN9XN46_PSOTE